MPLGHRTSSIESAALKMDASQKSAQRDLNNVSNVILRTPILRGFNVGRENNANSRKVRSCGM